MSSGFAVSFLKVASYLTNALSRQGERLRTVCHSSEVLRTVCHSSEVYSGYDPNGRSVLELSGVGRPATPGVKAAPEFSAAACVIAITT
jgi:hypothetical protein